MSYIGIWLLANNNDIDSYGYDFLTKGLGLSLASAALFIVYLYRMKRLITGNFITIGMVQLLINVMLLPILFS
jgi:hypothetical protein